jgi:hypothetical protein
MDSSSGAGSSVRDWLADPRGEFQRWRHPRPLLGAVILILGGCIIGYVPIQFTSELAFIGGAFTILGLLFAVLVVFCGIAALAKPQLSSVFGVLGIALSTLSLFGALGGLFLGMVVGTAGGILCYAWEPPADSPYKETTLADASEFIWQETGGFIWQSSSGFIWQTDRTGDSSSEAETETESGTETTDSQRESDTSSGATDEDFDLNDRYKL